MTARDPRFAEYSDGPLSCYGGRSVLVTGASGFIGRWVCQALSRAGAELWMVARDERALRRLAATYGFHGQYLSADLGDRGAFEDLVETSAPDATVNLVGYGVEPSEREERSMHRLNVELVEEMAMAVHRAAPKSDWTGCRFVHVGSAFEYGPLQGRITEETEARPNSAYGEAKLAATRRLAAVCERTGLRAVTARVPTVYGPGEHDHRLFPSLIRAASSGEPMELTSGIQERDFTYVEDVAEGLLRVGLQPDWPKNRVVNLCTGILTSVRGFVEAAVEILEIEADKIRLGALSHRPDEVWQGPLDVARLARATGWTPSVTVREGIRATRDFLAATQGEES